MTAPVPQPPFNAQPDLFLGYGGEVGRRKKAPFIIGVAVVVAVGATIGLIGHLFIGKTLPLPPKTVALAYLSPRTALPDHVPSVWQETRDASPHFPIFVGFARDASGALAPFGMDAGLFRWRLRGIEYTSDAFRRPIYVWSPPFRPFFSRAWLGIWPETYEPFADGLTDASVQGAISERRWRTGMWAPVDTDTPSLAIPTMNRLAVRAVPDAWPHVRDLLAENGIAFSENETPRIIQWRRIGSRMDFLLEFDAPPSIATRRRVAAHAGVVETGSFMLPDGTVGVETRAPEFETGDTDMTLQDGRQLKMWDRFIYLGDPNPDMQNSDAAPCSDKPALAVFDGQTTADLANALGLPRILPQDRLSFVRHRDRIDICW